MQSKQTFRRRSKCWREAKWYKLALLLKHLAPKQCKARFAKGEVGVRVLASLKKLSHKLAQSTKSSASLGYCPYKLNGKQIPEQINCSAWLPVRLLQCNWSQLRWVMQVSLKMAFPSTGKNPVRGGLNKHLKPWWCSWLEHAPLSSTCTGVIPGMRWLRWIWLEHATLSSICIGLIPGMWWLYTYALAAMSKEEDYMCQNLVSRWEPVYFHCLVLVFVILLCPYCWPCPSATFLYIC